MVLSNRLIYIRILIFTLKPNVSAVAKAFREVMTKLDQKLPMSLTLVHSVVAILDGACMSLIA